jgi:cysteine desulfurase / selenocysteine lyase
MDRKALTYLDNAASTWPKPPQVIQAVEQALAEAAANPGRSGHSLSIEAARIIADARRKVASLFAIEDPLRLVFTKNATEALNIVIAGLLRPGDHVITSGMEHNSVMRPLHAVQGCGVDLSVVGCTSTGELEPDDVKKAIRHGTKLIILTHASNVTGTIMPVSAIGAMAKENGIILCVDAAQSAGCLAIDVHGMNIDILAFTGHKSLYGPQGTGGLYIRRGLEEMIRPLMMGGTGSASEHEEQPAFMPDKYEAGTPNTPGLAGLLAGVGFISERGIDAIRAFEMGLTARLKDGLSSIPGVHVHGPEDPQHTIAVVSFTLDGMSPSDVSFTLDDEYSIMARPGLHCSPSAHKTIHTFPQGTVRLSPGCFTTHDDVDRVIHAVSRIASKRRT